LKIAYFINQYPKVSHTFIRREILALESHGFEVVRIALRGWQETLLDRDDLAEQTRTRYVLRDGVAPLFIDALRVMIRSPWRFIKTAHLAVRMVRESDRPLRYHMIYLAEACRILRWVTNHGCARLHAHFGTNSAEVAMLVQALGGPDYSFTVHGPDEFMMPMGLREKVRRAAFTVAISSFGRSQLYMRSHHLDWPRIHVVHCGLERSFYDGAAISVPTAPRFVCVGRLCEAKGQLLLIAAADRLKAAGIDFELVLVGDGPMRVEIEKLIDEHGLNSQVRITGWISSNDVRSEILAARALILPSFAEGLPVVLMEAMALRRPVLSTYVAGIPELVISGENGWLFAAGSVDELVDAMVKCLAAKPEDLFRMGDLGYQRVIARHSIETETAKLSNLFRAPQSRSRDGSV
jgi:colanic acid/amylovoran biosynthesis glycosyltransferase